MPLGPGKGFPGLGGVPIKFIVRDDQSRGEQARTLVEQLISVNKVHWFNGEGTSGITSLLQPVVESAGLPMTCHPCASPTLTEKGLKWFFRTGPNDKTMVASVFSFLNEWRDKGGPTNLKTIAFFTCDNLFCQDNRKVASELAPKAGYQVVLDLTSKTGATTLASEVQRLQAANPDVLFPCSTRPTPTCSRTTPSARAGAQGDRHQQRRLLRRDVAAGAEEDQRRRRLAGPRPHGHRPRARPSELEEGERDLQEVQPRPEHGRAGDARDHRPAVDGRRHQPRQVGRAGGAQKAANETKMGPEQLIIDYKGVQFENGQNVLATGVVTQVGWDGEKHTLWPWDLASKSGFKPLFPNPSWQERDSKPKPN